MRITSHPLAGPEATNAVCRASALNPAFRSFLRFVELDDAAYICALRADPTLARQTSPSPTELQQQRRWIERYKAREAAGLEFYFVIVVDGERCGVIRMHDFDNGDGASFSWGSWIIPLPFPPGLVPFSAIMMYELGFETLSYPLARLIVPKDNRGLIAFHVQTGATIEGEREGHVQLRYNQTEFGRFRAANGESLAEHRQTRIMAESAA